MGRKTKRGNMNFSETLKNHIKSNHLLNHPFYQAWMEGKISKETLKEYASQYYHHVSAFPRYISATHSNCADASKRQILLENLNEEEGTNNTSHPQLWLNFAEGMGANENTVKASEKKQAIHNVIETFLKHGKKSYAEGLAALYAYEYQVPEVAGSKIEGLENHYSINDEKTLKFFKVHQEADVYHREACEKLIDQFSPAEQKLALKSAKEASQALWDFLSSLPIEENKNAA